MKHAALMATLASVVLDSSPNDLKTVADRAHGRVALVRARALLVASVDDPEIREAVSLGS